MSFVNGCQMFRSSTSGICHGVADSNIVQGQCPQCGEYDIVDSVSGLCRDCVKANAVAVGPTYTKLTVVERLAELETNRKALEVLMAALEERESK
jgi:ribosomal protein L37AE/L43A